MIIDYSSHPLSFMLNFCDEYPEISELEFSIYRYLPRSVIDPRQVLRIPAKSFKTEIISRLEHLEFDEELACHSRVYIKSTPENVFHIPMIDFSEEAVDFAIEDILGLMKDFDCDRGALYNSGRSFHFYGFTLLNTVNWARFMGRLLLLNIPKIREIVDCRWVGHRLLAGYGALRWSKNTSTYKQLPTLNSWISLENYKRPQIIERPKAVSFRSSENL